jgi:hypothetical protein
MAATLEPRKPGDPVEKASTAEPLGVSERTSAGLRNALFDELDGIRKGTSNATRANAVAKLCMTIVETVRVEIDVAKFAEKHKTTPEMTTLASPTALKLG